jgi:hypothetical protein
MRSAELYLLRLEKQKESLLEAAAKAELVGPLPGKPTWRLPGAEGAGQGQRQAKGRIRRPRGEEVKVLDDISGGSAARDASPANPDVRQYLKSLSPINSRRMDGPGTYWGGMGVKFSRNERSLTASVYSPIVGFTDLSRGSA